MSAGEIISYEVQWFKTASNCGTWLRDKVPDSIRTETFMNRLRCVIPDCRSIGPLLLCIQEDSGSILCPTPRNLVDVTHEMNFSTHHSQHPPVHADTILALAKLFDQELSPDTWDFVWRQITNICMKCCSYRNNSKQRNSNIFTSHQKCLLLTQSNQRRWDGRGLQKVQYSGSKPEGNRTLVRPRHKREDNTKWILKN
jgi:hypothetical protein